MPQFYYPESIHEIGVGTYIQIKDPFGYWSETYRINKFCQSVKDNFSSLISKNRLRIVE